MTSLWQQLTTEEKIEQLRGDLKSTMTSVNLLIEHQNRLGERLRALQAEVRERAKQNIIGSSLFQVGELARTSPAMR